MRSPLLFYLDSVFNDTATTEIYTYIHTLSLHDALPISLLSRGCSFAGSADYPFPQAVSGFLDSEINDRQRVSYFGRSFDSQADRLLFPEFMPLPYKRRASHAAWCHWRRGVAEDADNPRAWHGTACVAIDRDSGFPKISGFRHR